MNAEDFQDILNNRLALTKSVLESKAEEYATGGDRLHNFKEAAGYRDSTPGEALLGMLVKHWVSIQDMVSGLRPITESAINEKIGDAINYLILLEAALKERIRGTN